MKQVNCNILSDVDTTTVTGPAIDSSQLVSMSAQSVFGDATAAGTVKIQASNDIDAQGPTSSFTPTNWSDVSGASAAVVSGVADLIKIDVMSFRWIRAVYTRSGGGSSTVRVNMFAVSV
jgi:hypothetical protein